MGLRSVFQCWGHAVPHHVLDNDSIESELNLESGWIQRRTGITSRRIASQDQATSELACEAAQLALDNSQQPTAWIGEQRPIGALILATSTPDHLLPPTAPAVASRLGLGSIGSFDMAVACSGFVYGVVVAQGLSSTLQRPILLIAANTLSRRVNPHDRATRSLFADAAGATVVDTLASDESIEGGESSQILATHLESNGEEWHQLLIPAGGSRHPITADHLNNDEQFLQINDGRATFRYAVESMASCGKKVLEKANLNITDVDWWIPHQANQRIIDEAQSKLGMGDHQVVSVVKELGNSSAATIPLACSLWYHEKKIRRGDIVLLTAAGAGLTAGAVLFRF